MTRLVTLCAITFIAVTERTYGSTTEPWKSVCSGQYEVAFFNEPMNNSRAEQACKDYGGELAHVRDDYIQTAINLTLSYNSKKYHVSNDTRSNSWDYYSWNSYDKSEKCIVVESGTLDTQSVSCEEAHYYICEKEWKVEIVNTSKSAICKAVGCGEAEMQWKRNSKTVPTSNEGGLYQIKTEGGAMLDLTNATVSDIDAYTCLAVNSDNVTKSNWTQIEVEAVPTVINITYHPCNSSVVVVWRPHPRSLGSEHRIRAIPGEPWESHWTQGRDLDVRYSVLRDMEPLTSYNIKIVPVTSSYMEPAYSTAKTFITTGKKAILPEYWSVEPFSSNKSCVISWTWPKGLPKNVAIRNMIRVNSSLSSRRTDSPKNKISFVDITEQDTYLTIHTVPNQIYQFEIHGDGCTKELGFGWSRCAGFPEAPDTIPAPEVSASHSFGTNTVTVHRPDETNGLVSCMFVIISVRPRRELKSSEFSWEDLLRASYSSCDTEDYIATAIENFKFTNETRVQFQLGNERVTMCEIDKVGRYVIDERDIYMRADKSVFLGQNRKLQEQTTYSVFVVSTTPSNDVRLRRSEEVTFTTGIDSAVAGKKDSDIVTNYLEAKH